MLGHVKGKLDAFCWCICGLSLLTASAAISEEAPPDTAHFHLEEILTIARGDDPPYALIDPEPHSIPQCLMGVQIDTDNNIYLCDNITETLIKLDREGEIVFSVGSKGEGPEDHREAGEPVFWPGCHVARSDLSTEPKLIRYGASGEYIDFVPLTGFGQFNRIWFAGDQGVAVAMNMEGYPQIGVETDVYLAILANDGAVKDSLRINHVEMPPMDSQQRPKESDFEVIPRLAIADDGRIFVLRDPYVYEIDCYDRRLQKQWTFKLDVPAPRRSDAEFDKIQQKYGGFIEPSPHAHVIRRIVPLADGNIWVERTVKTAPAGTVVFDRIGRDGSFLGFARLRGLPAEDGDFQAFGQRILWKLDDDVVGDGAENPFLVVYRILTG